MNHFLSKFITFGRNFINQARQERKSVFFMYIEFFSFS